MWPRWPTLNNFGITPITGSITGATQANPCVITTSNSLPNGALVTISGVNGMTQLNGNTYVISAVSSTQFTLTGIDSTAFGAYTSGGTWTTSQFTSFTIPTVPFLSKEVTMGVQATDGTQIKIEMMEMAIYMLKCQIQ